MFFSAQHPSFGEYPLHMVLDMGREQEEDGRSWESCQTWILPGMGLSTAVPSSLVGWEQAVGSMGSELT